MLFFLAIDFKLRLKTKALLKNKVFLYEKKENFQEVKMKKIQDHMINKIMSEKELRRLSRNWSPEEWENYLVENIEIPLKETQIGFKRYQKACAKMTESIFENVSSQEESTRGLKDKIRPAMKLLTTRERQVIRYLFWHNRTRKETAETLGIGLGNVHNLRKRALKKIESYFAQKPQNGEKKCRC